MGVAAAALAVGACAWPTRARIPDDWDAIGFVRAVATLRSGGLPAALPRLSRLRRARASSPARRRAGLGARLGGDGGGAVAPRRRARAVRAPAGWRWRCGPARFCPGSLGGAALSDATATAFVAAGLRRAHLARRARRAPRRRRDGAGLGTRVSYWPLALSFAVVVARLRPAAARRRRARRRRVATAALAPAVRRRRRRAPRSWALGAVHVAGHFADWGGSVATRPDLAARARRLRARSRLRRHLAQRAGSSARRSPAARSCGDARRRRARAPSPPSSSCPTRCGRSSRRTSSSSRATCCRSSPRLIARRRRRRRAPPARRRARCAALAFAASTPLLVARVRVPPAPVQLARWLAASTPARDEVVVFAAPLEPPHAVGRAVAATSRSAPASREVLGALERLDVLPRHIYVTSELADDDSARTPRLRTPRAHVLPRPAPRSPVALHRPPEL